MSKSMQMVFVGGNTDTPKHYHLTRDDCMNCPDDARAVAKHKIEPTHKPCGRCIDGAEGDSNSDRNRFACRDCGTERKIPNKSTVRCLFACRECNSVTTHDRVDA